VKKAQTPVHAMDDPDAINLPDN